jgi:hypothetical protein
VQAAWTYTKGDEGCMLAPQLLAGHD